MPGNRGNLSSEVAPDLFNHNMGLITRKPVFGVSVIARLKLSSNLMIGRNSASSAHNCMSSDEA